jgi:hypothetical protein
MAGVHWAAYHTMSKFGPIPGYFQLQLGMKLLPEWVS